MAGAQHLTLKFEPPLSNTAPSMPLNGVKPEARYSACRNEAGIIMQADYHVEQDGYIMRSSCRMHWNVLYYSTTA